MATRRVSSVVLLAVIFACAAARAQTPAPARAPAPIQVLFIGNSLTYFNDLPEMVAAMPCMPDGRPIYVTTIASPDTSLADHWKRGTARMVLKRDRWDLVVLQQGPSALPASRKELLESVRRFAPEIEAAGARPAMFMVWPSWLRREDFDAVGESYRQAAAAIDAVLFPVGEAWRAAWRRDPGLPLYAGDEVHPSPLGSYVAALVICSAVGGRSAHDLPASIVVKGKPIVLPKTHTDFAAASAAETLNRYPVPKLVFQEKKE